MMEDRMQRQRFEFKYLLTEDEAVRVGDFIDSYLERDPNSRGQADRAYEVHSLYLDSDNLDTYWWTVNGCKNRFKLRVRYYNDRPDGPLYFEIKRRMNQIILKQRAAVHKEAAPWILDGQLPEPGWLLSGAPEHLEAVAQFTRLAQRIEARPKVHVAYRREAWVDPRHDGVRTTLDRRVAAEPQPLPRFSTRLRKPFFPFGRVVILELKFTNRFPNWFRELVEAFDLVRCGAAKYCMGVTAIGEKRLGHRLELFAERGLDPDTLLTAEPALPLGSAAAPVNS
jgi:hypothetical protein